MRDCYLASICSAQASSRSQASHQSHEHMFSSHCRIAPPPTWREGEGRHFDTLFAADSFRIITPRLPRKLLTSHSPECQSGFTWARCMNPHPPPRLCSSSLFFPLPLADLTAAVLNFLPRLFPEDPSGARHTLIKHLDWKTLLPQTLPRLHC